MLIKEIMPWVWLPSVVVQCAASVFFERDWPIVGEGVRVSPHPPLPFKGASKNISYTVNDRLSAPARIYLFQNKWVKIGKI